MTDKTNLVIFRDKNNSLRDGSYIRGGGAQWVARLTRNVEVMGSSPINGPGCFLEQETLPLLLSTGWFERDFTIKLK